MADGPSDVALRLTMDFPEDLALIRGIYERLYPQNHAFGLADIRALRAAEPHLFEINRKHTTYI
jgi:spore coat polysaccharide biosynthesis protein SpsF